jgi:hypothetical protein
MYSNADKKLLSKQQAIIDYLQGVACALQQNHFTESTIEYNLAQAVLTLK